MWLIVGTATIRPFYLAYFNELVGGPRNGYKYLIQDDLDQGQDLKGLSAYLRNHNITRVKLAYLGTDDPRRYGIDYEPLVPGQPTTGDLAVSATWLTGRDPDCQEAFQWLWRFEPNAKIGYSIFVYRIPATANLPAATPFPTKCRPK